MTDRLQQLCDEICELKPGERAEVRRLLDGQEAMPEPAIERVWLAEARRRFTVMAAEAAAAEAEAFESAEAARERIAQHLRSTGSATPPRSSGR